MDKQYRKVYKQRLTTFSINKTKSPKKLGRKNKMETQTKQIMKGFKVGELIINKYDILFKVVVISPRGYTKVIPMVWSDLYIDPVARITQINPLHFRKATTKDVRTFQKRCSIKGHPQRN